MGTRDLRQLPEGKLQRQRTGDLLLEYAFRRYQAVLHLAGKYRRSAQHDGGESPDLQRRGEIPDRLLPFPAFEELRSDSAYQGRHVHRYGQGGLPRAGQLRRMCAVDL